MKILDERQIRQKIKRLAIEILERNYGCNEIILVGLNNNGLSFAQLLHEQINTLLPDNMRLSLTQLRLNPANPLDYPPKIDLPIADLQGKNIILVDDVANTGRTFFYAIQPLLAVLPNKVEVAVLVDRTHKSFPVQSNYVGLSLHTTLKDNIIVKIRQVDEMAVYLE